MCGLFGASPFTSNMSKEDRNAEANKQAAGTRMAAKGNYKSPKTGFQQVKDDIKMDLGMKPKDVDYYARLDDRSARSQKAMKELMAKANESDDRPSRAAPAAPKPPAPVAKAPEVPKPPKGTATTATAPKPEEKEGVGIGTAASGEAEAAAIEATAEGEAETKVADTARKGRRSQIATSAKGLLSEAPTRKRRSLMSGLIA